MSDTLEIVFEDIRQHDAIELLLYLLSQVDEVENIEFSREGIVVCSSSITRDELSAVFVDGKEDLTAFFKVKGLHLGNARVSASLIRLVKYACKYDVDFSFEVGTAKDSCTLMRDFHAEAKILAKKFEVTSLFGGLDPATDAETQYFVDEYEGPLMSA